jgi:hypothetical protein
MATIKLYINTDRGDISRAFVKSTSEPTTNALPPALVAGNKRNIEVYLIDSAGNYDARSGASNYALSIGAGPIAGTPSSGTFTLTDGTSSTPALAHNASAQVVEDALNALNSSAGPFSQLVDVTSTYDGNYLVKFRTTGAVAALSGDASELSPQSAVVVDEARAGDGSTKEQQYIRLLRQPAIFQDSFTQIANGWSGELSANNSRVLELMAGRDTIAIPLDVELTETGNEPETIARGNMLLSNEVINPASIDPANLAQLLTQALGDARYLRTTNNLSDVTNAATARSNIGAAAAADLTAHTDSTSNPHGVTAAQVGLGNVDNTSDADKPVSTAQQTALDLKADATALTTETNARIDADNRREFAGGVYLDGATTTFIQNKATLGNGINFSVAGSFVSNDTTSTDFIFRQNNSNPAIDLRIDNGNLELTFRSSSSTFVRASTSILQNKFYTFLVVCDYSNLAYLYVNGNLADTVTVSSLSTPIVSVANELFFGKHGGATFPWIGKLSDVAIFNTALTATQAAELYQQGLQPWLAANPEYRRGYASNLTNTWSLGNANTDFSSNTSSANQITATANSSAGSSGARLLYSFDNYVAEVGSTITATFDVTSITGGVTIKYMSSPFPSTASAGDTLLINSTGTFTYSQTITSKAYGLIAIFGADEAIDAELTSLTVSGSLATLPLDDDCRQLKDISGNRNDATASESGVTHLKQKDLHAFRDDNADGTGGSYLIANADIIAENEVITGVTVDGRFYAASGDQDLTKRRIKLQDHGSHVDVKRSNGTTDDSAIAVTNPSDGTDFAISVLTQRI